MPRRQILKPLPKYSFINVDPKGDDISWLKVHSGSVRRHAAYWGGAGRYQNEDEKKSVEEHDDTVVTVSEVENDEMTAAPQSSSQECVIRI
jgi:hypothetical protein